MSKEARSSSHRWLFAPDCIAMISGRSEVVRGALVRQRLTTTVKPGWRAATWDDLDHSDPSTKEAFDYKRELDAKGPPEPRPARPVVMRDGVPDAAPPRANQATAAVPPKGK